MELQIVKFFNRLGRGTWIDGVTRFVSSVPMLAVSWTLLAMIIFFLDKNGSRIATAMTIAMGFHFVISREIIKIFLARYFKRTRPYIRYADDVSSIGKEEIDSSFPSSHMSANLSLVSVLVYFYPSVLAAAIVWVALMAFARLHNGMHYASDIIGGIVLGIVYGILGIYFSEIELGFDFLRILI